MKGTQGYGARFTWLQAAGLCSVVATAVVASSIPPSASSAEEPVLDRWQVLEAPVETRDVGFRGVAAWGDRAWIVGYRDPFHQQEGHREPVILRSINRGPWEKTPIHWGAHEVQKYFKNALEDVLFTDSDTGYAVGRIGFDPEDQEACCPEAILGTDDGGVNWTLRSAAGPPDQTGSQDPLLTSVSCTDLRQCHAVGALYAIRNTSDGFANFETARGVSGVGGTNLIELRGVSFTKGPSCPQSPPSAQGCLGWAVAGDGAIIATEDGGANWRAQVKDTPNGNGVADLNDVWFADHQHGWAVGGPRTFSKGCDVYSTEFVPCPPPGRVLATIDGKTWSTQMTTATGALHAVSFAGRSKGWAVGSSGTILHTSNGGLTWAPQVACKLGTVCLAGSESAVTEPLFDVHAFPDPSTGLVQVYAVGGRGTIIRLTSTYTPEPEGGEPEPGPGPEASEEDNPPAAPAPVQQSTSLGPGPVFPSENVSAAPRPAIRPPRAPAEQGAPAGQSAEKPSVSNTPSALAGPEKLSAGPPEFARLTPKPVDDVAEQTTRSGVHVWLVSLAALSGLVALGYSLRGSGRLSLPDFPKRD